jgi:hypothetical protein
MRLTSATYNRLHVRATMKLVTEDAPPVTSGCFGMVGNPIKVYVYIMKKNVHKSLNKGFNKSRNKMKKESWHMHTLATSQISGCG